MNGEMIRFPIRPPFPAASEGEPTSRSSMRFIELPNDYIDKSFEYDHRRRLTVLTMKTKYPDGRPMEYHHYFSPELPEKEMQSFVLQTYLSTREHMGRNFISAIR